MTDYRKIDDCIARYKKLTKFEQALYAYDVWLETPFFMGGDNADEHYKFHEALGKAIDKLKEND